VRPAGGDTESVIRGIGSFDADHLAPLVGRHIGHTLCLVNPRIPYDRGFGAALFDNNAAIPHRVAYDASGVGIQMDLIGFLGDANGLAAQFLPFESIGLVDVQSAIEPETEV
jgi:hypothetical protein